MIEMRVLFLLNYIALSQVYKMLPAQNTWLGLEVPRCFQEI